MLRKIAFGFTFSFFLINLCLAQSSNSSDFIELGIRSSKFIESTFLENSIYQSELSDPGLVDIGYLASPTGNNYSAKFRYGKRLFSNVHLITEVGISIFNEQVVCFCHACDKISIPSTLVSLNSINAGIGVRYQIFKIDKIKFSIETIGSYSFISNESGLKYFGYSIHPFIGYRIKKGLNINLKIGYEESFKDYEKKERFVELALNYLLKKKSS